MQQIYNVCFSVSLPWLDVFCRWPAILAMSRQTFPYHHWIPSDLNLSAFLAWIQSAPLRAQLEVALARLPIITHRHPLESGPAQPVRFATACGEQTLQPCGCTAVGASDAIREEGTSDLRSAFRAVAPQALTATHHTTVAVMSGSRVCRSWGGI